MDDVLADLESALRERRDGLREMARHYIGSEATMIGSRISMLNELIDCVAAARAMARRGGEPCRA